MSEKNLTILTIILILVISLISFIFSPYFELRNLEINGSNELSQDYIKENISSYLNKNIWLIRIEDIKEKLANNNYIRDMEIVKKFPGTLKIKIQERVPLAKINNDGEYLVFNKNGYIIKRGSIHEVDVPEIIGVAYSFNNNNIIFPSDFSNIVQALKNIDREKRKHFKTIIKKDNKIDLFLKENIKVNLGSMEKLNKKFTILESLFNKILSENQKIEYINLSIANKPVIKIKNIK